MCEGTPLDPVRHRLRSMAMKANMYQRKEKVYGKDKHQRKSLQHRQRRTAQPAEQGTRLHTPGTIVPKRTMVGNEDSGRAGGHKGKVQTTYRAIHAEESDTHSGRGCRHRGRNDTPAASGFRRTNRGTLRNTHVSDIHPQGRGGKCLGRNTEAWKPNYHAHMIFDWTDGETGRTRKLNKQDMAEMQTILAECLGMERGISSDRKHLSAIQYKNMVEAEKAAQIEKECRQMEHERNAITDEVERVGKKLEDAQEKLKDATTEIKVQKLKGAAADTGAALLKAGTTVIDATASLFNSGKVKRQEQEIAELKRENYELKLKNQNLQGNLRTANKETERERENVRRALQSGAEKLKPITDLFPCMENAKENIEELRSMGIGDNDIRLLLTGKEITYSGNLYDRERRKTHQVRNVKIDIAKARNGYTTIWLNNFHFKEFFKQLWQQLQKALGIDKGMGFHR